MRKIRRSGVALITGANQGLGEALAMGLFGYDLILCDKNMNNKFDNNWRMLKIKCDVTKKSQVIKAVKQGIKRFGRIDILINNAGLMLFDNFENIKEKDIDKMYNVNVKGTLFFSQAVLPIMKKQKAGYIINISSTRGITGAPTKGAYATTKFGVRALAETLFLENKEYGIKTTSICPGKLANNLVTYADIVSTVQYLLTLGPKANVREIIIGGQL